MKPYDLGRNPDRSLKGTKLIPNISIVKGYIIFPVEISHFILKEFVFVMSFLIADIFNDASQLQVSDRKDGITILPAEFRKH